MIKFLGKRLGFAVIVIFCVEVAVFLITHALGNPARLMLPFTSTNAEVRQFSHQMGFDRPLLVQFWSLIRGAVHGDFGISYWQQQPATQLVLDRLPYTMELVALAILLAIVVAVPLGVLAAVKRDSLWDRLAVSVSLLGVSMPAFWLGELLVLVFAVRLHLVPTNGYGGPQYFVLPVITLAALPLGRLTQIVRSSMLDQLGQQYMLVGEALGLGTFNRVFRHALKNAAIPIVTMMGWELGRLIAGFTVLVEYVFNWPGVGLLAFNAIQHHDIPLIEADVTIVAILIVGLNFILDVVYAVLDPRIHGRGAGSRRKARPPTAPLPSLSSSAEPAEARQIAEVTR
ncbi:MAG: ABC transporter permease [Jatrophihabitantaceae bacterium]